MRRVSDIMSADCITVAPQSSLSEAALLMQRYDIGFIPVVEGKRLKGVVTDRDLAIRGYAEQLPASTAVTTVMTAEVWTITPGLSVDEAAAVMANRGVKRLAVVLKGELCGILSLGDLAARKIFLNEAGTVLDGIHRKQD